MINMPTLSVRKIKASEPISFINSSTKTVSGIAFGNDRCIRISCAASEKTIREGLRRLANIVERLRN